MGLDSKGQLIIERDANTHPFQWSSKDINAKNEYIFDFILK